MDGNILVVIGMPIIRGVAGWAEKALADGKISTFEWKKLGETILRLGVPAAALYWGFKLPVEMAVAAPIIVDYLYRWIKKLIEKNKK